jgi:putative transposase
MSRPRYQWRQLTPVERDEVLCSRQRLGSPWHSPPHRASGDSECANLYHITAACYEHLPIIGTSPTRMDEFAGALKKVFELCDAHCCAWCILPNHYHALVESADVFALLRELGRLHGRSSYAWNGEDAARGRKVFFRAVERSMRSTRHVWATMNYVHNNPVRHGYAERWTEWPWSSAQEYLDQVGREEAARIWRCYPILDFGDGWDDPKL